MHCFCTAPKGFKCHGHVYLCSVDCQHVVQTPTHASNDLIVAIGGEHLRSPVGVNHFAAVELPDLPPTVDQPSSPIAHLYPHYLMMLVTQILLVLILL